MELYWGSGSIYAWRVMLVLLFKGEAFEDRLLSFRDRDHKQLGYTSLNPRAKVPTLVDGDVVITETNAILAYIERVRTRIPVLGETPADTARIWQKLAEIDTYVIPAAMPLAKALELGLHKPILGELRERRAELFVELDRLEAACERGPFNAVDAAMVPILATLKQASLKAGAADVGLFPVDWTRWGRLEERYQAVRALDGFERSWPRHWS